MYPFLTVFDIAGTTVNDRGLVQATLIDVFHEKTGITIDMSRANSLMGIPKPVAFEYLCKDHNIEFRASFVYELTTIFEQRLIAAYGDKKNIEPMPYAEEVMLELRKNSCKVVLDTGFSKVITATIMHTLQWGGLVDATISSDEVNRGRPHPDMIFEAMNKCDVHSHAMVAKVGDTISDLSEGYAAGCGWVIGVATGACTKDEFERFPHTHIISDLSELLHIFH
ncbi:MAG: hypothetical protein RL160_770 [Bacteroidota bacterium]